MHHQALGLIMNVGGTLSDDHHSSMLFINMDVAMVHM